MARVLGRRGGLARGRRLSADETARIAAAGGHARARSLEAARRIVANVHYAAAVRHLGRAVHRVDRHGTAADRLPGLYPARP